MGKREIRKEIFAKRKALSADELRDGSHAICRKIIEMDVFRDAACLYTYMDYNGEASTQELIKAAWAAGKRVAAPKVFGEDMRYFYIRSYEEVAPGYFQIPEPIEGLAEAAEEDALLIVPGVAFDRNRHRCGYGKGFYDRYLSAHTGHPTIAIALDFQIVDAVPADEFDIFPQVLVTPTQIFL